MRPVRAAVATGAGVLTLWLLLGWLIAGDGDDAPTLSAVASAVVFVGLPFVAATAVVAYRVAGAARGPDLAARVLAVATSGRADREDWGAAMRAELAHIEDPGERRRFALGCAPVALRTGLGRAPRFVALAAFGGFAVATFAGSRVLLAGDRAGLLVGVYLVPVAVFAVGFVAARMGRSFRAGLVSSCLVLFAGLAGILVVAAPEAVTWYHHAGVWIIDGDYPKGGIAGPGDAIRDAITGMTIFVLLFAAPWPVLGAAAGAVRRHRMVPGARGRGSLEPAGAPGTPISRRGPRRAPDR